MYNYGYIYIYHNDNCYYYYFNIYIYIIDILSVTPPLLSWGRHDPSMPRFDSSKVPDLQPW